MQMRLPGWLFKKVVYKGFAGAPQYQINLLILPEQYESVFGSEDAFSCAMGANLIE